MSRILLYNTWTEYTSFLSGSQKEDNTYHMKQKEQNQLIPRQVNILLLIEYNLKNLRMIKKVADLRLPNY